MKTQTRINDFNKFLELQTAEQKMSSNTYRARVEFDQVMTCNIPIDLLSKLINASHDSKRDYAEKKEIFNKLPRDRREYAAKLKEAAHKIGLNAAKLGDNYSGYTQYACVFGKETKAYTITYKGSRYSSSCKYHKTDAIHKVVINIESMIKLIDNPHLINMSANDGLHLIALNDDNSCIWVQRNNKQIIHKQGWIAWNDTMMYHSTESHEHAVKGLERKIKIAKKEEQDARNRNKEYRRARLIAKLCNGVHATIEDAKSLGYCDPGIDNFKSRYNIGNTATLNQLLNTKDSYAIRLALHIARKLKKNKVNA